MAYNRTQKITINNNTTGDDSNDINVTNAFNDNTNSLSSYSIPVFETDNRSTLGFFADSVGMDPGIVETTSESDSKSRTLIVISVRGSVTPLDWAMDY